MDDVEQIARSYSGSVQLSRRLERDADGLARITGEELVLTEDGRVELERYSAVHPDQFAGYVVLAWDELPLRVRRGRAPADLPAPPGTRYQRGELPWEARWAVRPQYRPFDDDEFAAAAARLQAAPVGALTLWPSNTYAGRVALAGSRDRWVIGCGFGGYLRFLPGAYRSAADAEAALRAELERRQQRLSQIIAERCAPHAVRCVFPALQIEVRDDPSLRFEDLSNRATRRGRGV